MTKEVLIASRVPSDLVAELKKVEEAEHIDRSTALRFPLEILGKHRIGWVVQ